MLQTTIDVGVRLVGLLAVTYLRSNLAFVTPSCQQPKHPWEIGLFQLLYPLTMLLSKQGKAS